MKRVAVRTFKTIGALCAAWILCASAAGCQVGKTASRQQTEKAVKSFKENKFDSATAALRQALDKDPNNAEAYYWLARIDMKYKDFKNAQLNLQTAIGIDPNNVGYSAELIEVHKAQGEYFESEGLFDEAIGAFAACARVADEHIGRDPFDARSQLNRARCLRQSREYAASVEAYEASIRANPFLRNELGQTEHYKELAELYKNFGFYAEAVRVLNNGILNNVGDGVLEIALADVLREKGDYHDALAHYERAEQFMIDKEVTMLNAASAMYGAGMAAYELARIEENSQHLRDSGDLFIKSKKWLSKYIENAHAFDERFRKAQALQLIKIIDGKLAKDSIGNEIEEKD